MPTEEIELHLLFKDEETDDEATSAVAGVLPSYIEHIANKKLVLYKGKIYYGGKAGESLWTHIMNLVFVTGRLLPLFFSTDRNASSDEKNMRRQELCCLLLALTVHDINKLDQYGKRPDGRDTNFANASSLEKLRNGVRRSRREKFLPGVGTISTGHQISGRLCIRRRLNRLHSMIDVRLSNASLTIDACKDHYVT